MESCIRGVRFMCKPSVSLRRKRTKIRTHGFHVSCGGVGIREHLITWLATQDPCAKK